VEDAEEEEAEAMPRTATPTAEDATVERNGRSVNRAAGVGDPAAAGGIKDWPRNRIRETQTDKLSNKSVSTLIVLCIPIVQTRAVLGSLAQGTS